MKYSRKYWKNSFWSLFVDKGAQTIQVDEVVIHPEFVPATLLNDICLLKLKTPIEMNSKKNAPLAGF